MAEVKVEPRETSWRQLLPWTELFRGFQVALDLNKLALAAAGILVMAFLWWLLAVLFTAGESAAPPEWPGVYRTRNNNDDAKAWAQFKQDRDHWNLMHESAGLGREDAPVTPTDLLDSYDEYQTYQQAVAKFDADRSELAGAVAARNEAVTTLEAARKAGDEAAVKKAQKEVDDAERSLRDKKLDDFTRLLTDENLKPRIPEAKARQLAALQMNDVAYIKPYATLATWPWFENRGPNPYLMATGQLGKPWETGHFWDWLMTQQVPVLLEPVAKLLAPVIYFYSPGADVKCRLYFLCVLLATVLTWAVFGGAITRIAAVQVARGEKIGLMDALNFTRKRILSYITAPLFPLLVIFVLLVVMVIFGYPFMIPIFGDIIVAGIFWPVMILVGLLMAITLVGLVGWPLMSATVSAEGTDSWEAVSRAYSYVYQKPWHFIWYTVVALVYGAIIVFFVGFMGSLSVYLAKWGVSQTPGIAAAGREPNFLFVYAPKSFGWRGLLLQGAVVDGEKVVDSEGRINQAAYNKWVGADDSYKGGDRLAWWNLIGAFLVAIWLWIAFLLIIGFNYSYFWSASTVVYMLLRRNVDGAEMDEVTLEDDEGEAAFGGPLMAPAAPPATAIKEGATSLTMVDAPSLRPSAPPAAPLPPAPAVPSSPPAEAPPETAGSPVPPGPAAPPADDGGAPPRSEVGTAPTEPRP
jgi:hypothetical protein